MAEEKDDWLDEIEETDAQDESGDELDQSDIDALLVGGTDDSEEAAADMLDAGETVAGLDSMDDMDELFKEGTGGTEAGPADMDDVSDLFADIGIQGIDHHPKSVELVNIIMCLDFKWGGDYFCFKAGGDGDNGEHLMYLLDIYFETNDEEGE